MMVNICGKCDYLKDKQYCERLGIECRFNSPICEYYIKRGKDGSNSKDGR